MEPQTNGSGATPRDAAAASVTPDPLTASILAKHSAGQPLTPQESGKLGAWRASINRAKAIFTGKGGTPVPVPGPTAAANGNAALAPLAPGQASADRMPPVAPDEGLCRRVGVAVLNRIESAKTEWVTSEARKAGATGAEFAQAVERLRNSACLSPSDRKLLEELSPDVMAEMGLNPRQFALWIAAAVIGGSAWNTWLAVGEIREIGQQMRKEKPAEPNTTKAAALKEKDTKAAVGNPLDAERKKDLAVLKATETGATIFARPEAKAPSK